MNESHQSIADVAAERRHHSKQVKIERIRTLIAQGYTLSAIAGKRGLANIETVQHWFAEDESLRAAYEQARDLRNDLLADAAVALADAGSDSPANLKLRIDARKWRVELDRKDEAKGETPAAKKAKIKARTDELVRALERSKKYEAEDRKRRKAELAVELSKQYGFTLDQETIDLAKPRGSQSYWVDDEAPSDGA